ncbi:DnaT-like ssDNA-binding protein [Nitrosomonas ureae]|uniref:Putative DnaT-like domain-containing protein n=1 Tax=Nitrosomonas ureae TaxID=44577 RepID=A0A1H2ENB5_9PROT|nr:DnaT-like ssDNA-binding protein [Nitrosomonas ureae]ALQ51917.1 hypothetical protein ATY38_12215 [Nitrosomonas ureae]SDT96616.1 hypothetical protein SAMN05216406_11425 [Nitrosomonas ureae]
MAFIVEDGTGMADANSYESVENADAHFAALGISAWSGSGEVKEAAMRAGTEYIEIRWRGNLKGRLQFPDTQALLFPRINIYDEEGRLLSGTPKELRIATCEYALISLSQILMPNPIVDSSGRILIEESEGTGPLTETKKYQAGYLLARPYPKADSLMSVFVKSSGGATCYV